METELTEEEEYRLKIKDRINLHNGFPHKTTILLIFQIDVYDTLWISCG